MSGLEYTREARDTCENACARGEGRKLREDIPDTVFIGLVSIIRATYERNFESATPRGMNKKTHRR